MSNFTYGWEMPNPLIFPSLYSIILTVPDFIAVRTEEGKTLEIIEILTNSMKFTFVESTHVYLTVISSKDAFASN